MDVALKIVYGLISIGILILIHELGHFLIAKLFGVRVEIFSLGLGAGILKYKKGDTVYQLGVIPLGGFCKMAGEEPNDELTGAPDEFYSKPPLKRLGIVFAGPFVNYLFGIFIFIIVMAVGIKQPTFTNKIAVMKEITIDNQKITSPAQLSGLVDGDRIIKIDDENISNWTLIRKKIVISGDKKKRKITVKRGKRVLDFKVKPVLDPDTGASLIGILPYINGKIAGVTENGAASKSGLLAGDEIIKINNKKINNFYDVKSIISVKANQRITLQIKRGNQIKTFRLKVKEREGKGFIGVSFNQEGDIYISKSKNVIYAVSDGFKRANKVITEVFYGLKLMVSGKIKVLKAVKSPVAIVYYAGKTTEAGFLSFIWFMGYISIALAFFNLLPIPAVDGSYILFFLFEIISGKELNFKVVRAIQYVGLMVLMGLLFMFMFNDILGLFKGTAEIKGVKGFMS